MVSSSTRILERGLPTQERPVAHPLHIMELRHAEALTGLRDEWNALLEHCERATLYQTWEWNEAWWQMFHRRKRLRLLLLRRGETLVGIVPLYVSRHLGTPLRRLAFLGTGAADYLDVLCREADAPAVYAAMRDYLEQGRGYDMADFQQMRPTALLHEAAQMPAAPETRLKTAETVQEVCPSLTLPNTYDAFAARLSKSMRYHISRHEKSLRKDFPTISLRLADAAELPHAMTALFDLHQKRWNARLLPGVLGGDRIQAFHRLVAERFAARGWLRLYLAQTEERTLAALYCFRFRERHYYYLGGFAPELGKYSLGTLLMNHAIRAAIAEGCTEFDFLRGNEAYKYRWQPTERPNYRLLLVKPRSLRSRALLELNKLERVVERKAKAFAEQRGRKPPEKKSATPTEGQKAGQKTDSES